MDQVLTALLQYGLPTLLLAIVSWAFWGFLRQRDREYQQLTERHAKTVLAKDKEIARLNEEIARLNEARMTEQQQARAELAQVARGALEMSEALADLQESSSR